MADQISNPNYSEVMVNGLPLPSRTVRKNIVVVTILTCWFFIGYLIFNGQPTNTLHQNALAWSFALMGTVISGYVFGAVLDNWNFWKSAKDIIVK